MVDSPPIRVRYVPYGPPATAALREEVSTAKAGDPLAAVRVVVANRTVGLATRRALAGDGVANVAFTTLDDLAAEIATASLVGSERLPLTETVAEATARAVLDEDPGSFAPVAAHPSTAAGLARTRAEMRPVDTAGRSRLARHSSTTAEVVRLIDEMDRRLAGRYWDAHDVLSVATGLAPDRVTEPVICHLPEPLSPDELAFLRALGSGVGVVALVGYTGDGAADTAASATARTLGPSEAAPAGEPPSPTEVLSCPSADVEVLLALRRVMERLREGVPLHQMAVLYGTAAPYARLLAEQLSAEGIPFSGPGTRRLSETTAGRALLGALALGENGWRRDEVIAWFSTAPIRHDARRVPVARWDRISSDAGVVKGLDAWDRQLTRYADEQTESAAALGVDDPDNEKRREAAQSRAEAARQLRAAVGDLASDLETEPGTWQERAQWARRLMRRWLADAAGRQSWPAAERQAAEEIDAALEALGGLDGIDPAPDRARFRAALAQRLDRNAASTSRFQEGLLVGPVDLAVGLELDLVVVVGMADGTYPPAATDDPLLPDQVRRSVGEHVPLRGRARPDLHRRHLAVLAAAPERICSYPRGDLRSGRELRPSRWWLDGLGTLIGADQPLYSRDLPSVSPGDGYQMVPSQTAAVRGPGEPVGPGDFDQRLLLAHHEVLGTVAGHWLTGADPILRRGLRARAERREGRYGPTTGRTGRRTIGETPVFSPTALERYANCPRRHLLGDVLGLRARDKPEELLQMEVLRKGNLVHDTLEEFLRIQTELPAGSRIQPHEPWSDEDHQRLDDIFDRLAAQAESAGTTGHAVLWGSDRETIRRELHRFLEHDDRHRATMGATPESVEHSFGFDEPVILTLPEGRALGFRGRIDRIDSTPEGRIVLDYKNSQQTNKYRAIEEDPVDRGERLQHLVYGFAARAAAGLDPADTSLPVTTGYWLTREKVRFAQTTVELDEATLERATETLRVLFDGLASGDFPARPGKEKVNCTWCDFTDLCPPDRDHEWAGVRRAPELAEYVSLVEPDPPDEQDDEQ